MDRDKEKDDAAPREAENERKIVDEGAEQIRRKQERDANPLAPPVNTGAGS